jgi:hypothetical protein
MIYILLFFSLILFLLAITLVWAHRTGKDIQIASIKGFMFGALYDVEEVDGEQWHTLQILVGILSINILWETNQY